MPPFLFLSMFFLISIPLANAQGTINHLRKNAIQVDNPDKLSDSAYRLFEPFQLIMVGEMHGTNEPAKFVKGLANLFAENGDSVQVGLEIPSQQMKAFLASHTDSSIYQSDFFSKAPSLDGRASLAWAGIISSLKNNPKVKLFFFDRNEDEGMLYERDSLMYVKIKNQIGEHPHWRVITICGNAHNRIAPGEKKASYFLRRDAGLALSSKICSINHYYLRGSCMANFGHGLEEKKFDRPLNEYDTTFQFDNFLLLKTQTSSYPYTGIYYTKYITLSKLVRDNVDLRALKNELYAIYDRDQKTRTGRDSFNFGAYIDSCNLIQVEAIISKYGWLGKSCVGGRGNTTLYLVIQHADLATQEKYFPLLQQSVADSESRPCDLAYLQDRILMRQGKKQLYGSQVVRNKTTGVQEFYPIEDEKNVNDRRRKVGLDTIETYATYFGIKYQVLKE